jgi:hypothetical protein
MPTILTVAYRLAYYLSATEISPGSISPRWNYVSKRNGESEKNSLVTQREKANKRQTV